MKVPQDEDRVEQYLDKIKVTERIRDPLYGFIYLTKTEKKIIDTAIFQRLRRIHQLALTKYVYPSAEHSRFVHSLGVMHCATLILAGVFDHKNSTLFVDPNEPMIKTLRMAALLHDIGHLPFSHAAEKQWLSGLKHEDLSQFIIENHPELSNIMKEDGINPQIVSSLLAKQPTADWRLAHEIISGQLDADRADYLLRDSHHCGVRYGEYDFVRFLTMFAAVTSPTDGHLDLVIDEADLHVAESMLIARYHYNMQIPYHRTRSGFDFALRAFVLSIEGHQDIFTIDNDKLKAVDMEKLADLDDYTIMEQAKKERKNDNKWASYVLREKHLVTILDTRDSWENEREKFKKYAQTLRKDKDLKEGEDFFVQEDTIELIKGLPMRAEDQGCEEDQKGREGSILVRVKNDLQSEGQFVDIIDRSWIFKQLSSHPEKIYRIFAPDQCADYILTLLKN